MPTTLQAPFFPQFTIVVNGVVVPAAGYKLRTTLTGTSTAEATYQDQAGLSANTNPITLDSLGMCELWLTNGIEYRLALYDPTNTTLQSGWPLDDIAGIPIVSTTQYVPLAGAVTMTGLFELSGNATAALNPVTLQQFNTGLATNLTTASTIASSAQTATSTGGTSTVYTLTPTNALAAYATGAVRKAIFSVASGAAPTMNISGLGAKSLKQYENDAKVAARVPSGFVADLTYDGTDLIVTPAQGGYGTIAAAFSYTHPGGWIEKRGTSGTIALDTIGTVTFPVAFPNNCFGVVANPSTDSGVGGAIFYSWGTHTFTTASFKISNDASASTFTWIAWGN
jgi:hypothetical protein